MSLPISEQPFPEDEYYGVCVIGEGLCGQVNLYWHPASETFRAVKFAKGDQNAENLTAFRREVQMLSSCFHPAAVRMFRCGFPPDRPGASANAYIEMEFVPGGDLHDVINTLFKTSGTVLDLPVLLRILLGTARAIAVLHEKSIIHRDIKPQNILIDANLEPYLADFGFAREVCGHLELTRVGTPNYMAPEVLSGQYTNAVDVWSFGMLVFHARTGLVPYGDRGEPHGDPVAPHVVIAALENGEPPVRPPADPFPQSDPLYALYAACTVREPSRRLTITAVAEELLGIARAHLAEGDLAALEEYDRRLATHERDTPAGTLETLLSAVSQGSKIAITSYGWMKYRGIVFDQDEEEGMKYLLCARDRGSSRASQLVDEIAEETGTEPPDSGSWFPEFQDTFSSRIMT
jgi:serine/threonine protein kinase